jgi:uncharacterized protein (TIGR03503 family)
MLSALFAWGLFASPLYSSASDEKSTPREKQTREKSSGKKKKKKSREQSKRENDFENNISDSKPSHQKFDEELEEEPKFDAVILLDSSGSMLRTDPNRLRDQAAKLFVRFLGEKDRVSLFQFDQEVKRLTEFVPVNAETIHKLDEAIQSVSTEGRFTDLALPLETALSTLRSEARPGVKKIVILLSDGQMDPHPSRGEGAAVTDKLLTELMPLLRSDRDSVYTVSLSAEADRALLAKIAQEGNGLEFEAVDVQTLHKRFSDLYLSLKRPQVVEAEAGGFEIDGSIDEATFYISHKKLEKQESHEGEPHSVLSEVVLRPPTNERITMIDFPPGVRWYRGDMFDVITIKKPTPGTWRIEGIENPEGFATLVTDLKLQASFEKTNLKVGESQTLSVRLTSAGRVFNEEGLKAVSVYRYKVISTANGSTVQQGNLLDNGEAGDETAGDGIYSVIIRAPEEGDFKLLTGVTSATFSRQQQIPFEVSPGAIQLKLENGDSFQKTPDTFIATLTSKGKKLKSPEVDFLAKRSEDQKILAFKSKSTGSEYRFDTTKLNPGKYLITARISGKNAKTGEIERNNSEAIEYEKIATEHTELQSEAENEVSGEQEEIVHEDEGPNELVPVSLSIVIAFIWAGGLVFYMTKKVDVGKSLPPRETKWVISEELEARIKAIEAVVSQHRRPATQVEYELFDLVREAIPVVVPEVGEAAS